MIEEEQRGIFRNWLESHSGAIFKIIRAYANNPEDREDLFQEIALHIWYSIPKFQGRSSAITWIYRIALNTALKWHKKEISMPKSEVLENDIHVLNEDEDSMQEELNWLYREIYSLDPIDRCIVLLMFDQFSYKEMSTILGISESNIGVKINRIKNYLLTKVKLKSYGV